MINHFSLFREPFKIDKMLKAHARFMNMYGYHGARLDPAQSIRGPTVKYRTLLIATISPALFYAPEVYLKRLEKIWVDKAIMQESWEKLTDGLRDDWNLLVTNVRIQKAIKIYDKY